MRVVVAPDKFKRRLTAALRPNAYAVSCRRLA